ncbi:DMT family transporter [Radiobacillus kanasensis]|uniref:DMT family transporter n=1 Tax=Radiobacillus kanasensis TaxID=2844358 RepID=UPI001E368083|nr:DMT family transporter [Radiobacillus kanasensis]UFU00109.1 DMT family transporter [Radiobacillus kanasensis]
MKTSHGLLLTFSVIAISFAAIFVKWSEAPATIISMYRMYLACVLLLPILWFKREDIKRLTKKDWLFLALSGVFLAMHFALWFGSLKLTTVASSTIILSLQPIVALIGGFIFYKERVTIATILTIGISIVGVVIIGWGDLGLSTAVIIGDILSFLCVIAVVCYLLIGQNKVKTISHWVYSFFVFLFAGMALSVFNLIAGVSMVGYSSREWGIFALLAIFPTAAHVIYNSLLKYMNTATISMTILGEPVGATILAAILLNEQIIGMQIVGGFFVLVGVFLFLMQQRKEAAKQKHKGEELVS